MLLLIPRSNYSKQLSDIMLRKFQVRAVNGLRSLNQRYSRNYSVEKVALSVGMVAGYVHHKLVYKSNQTLALCESAAVVEVATKHEAVATSASQTLKKELQKLLKSMQTAIRYMHRLMTYFLFGLPLCGLVPVAYAIGPVFPPAEEMTWNYLLWAITKLGPCFIKMAQWASTRPDLFKPSLIVKLESLQDDVQIHQSGKMIDETMTDAFGQDWRSKIDIDPNPVGAGSVAQVYKGTVMKENKEVEVAIKLIHPNVEKLIKVDMELLSTMANIIDWFPDLEILSIGETCRQFADSMRCQLDLRVEAKNLIVFSKNFINEKWAVFPEPVEGLVTKNVLVETLMEGTPIAAFMQMKSEVGDEIDKLKLKLSDLGVRLILKMIFFDNFIHGDLHPGNLFVKILPNGEPRLGVIDCGIVYSSKSDEEHKRLVDICFAFMQHNGRKAGEMMLDHGTSDLTGDKALRNTEEFCDGIQDLVSKAEQENVFEHLGEYVTTICNIARDHLVRLDPGYFKIAMALKVAEGISLSFDRELDVLTKCVPIIMKARALRAMGVTKFPHPEEYDQEAEAKLSSSDRIEREKRSKEMEALQNYQERIRQEKRK